MASALKPDYFAEKVNIFIALAPIVFMKNQINYALRFMSNHLKFFEFILVDVFRLYNILPPSSTLNIGLVIFCTLFRGICDIALNRVSDREVKLDNMARSDVYYSMFPSGCGYKNFLHYA